MNRKNTKEIETQNKNNNQTELDLKDSIYEIKNHQKKLETGQTTWKTAQRQKSRNDTGRRGEITKILKMNNFYKTYPTLL